MGNVLVDMTGQRCWRLTVIERAESNKSGRAAWKCRCDCGKETTVDGKSLRNGNTASCGCLGKDHRAQALTKHSGSRERLWWVWYTMRNRCNNPRNNSYKNYGGRGIRVCEEWHDYAAFRAWALANGYDENAAYGKCTIDRIDVNGNYEPSNCRWVSMAEQNRNKRKTTGEGK